MSLNCSISVCRGAIEIKADYAEAFYGPPSPKAVEVRLDPARHSSG
jgi:hypothetical protein